MDGHRRAAGALILLGAVGLAGCHSPGPAPSFPAAQAPTPRNVVARLHADLADFEVREIAVVRPTGDHVHAGVVDALRDGLYRGLLSKGYSPLAPEYVDADGASAADGGRTFPMRAHITAVRRSRDGGHVVSAWAGLVSPRDGDDSEETLYLCEITDLAIQDIDADGARALAAALLQRLPAR